jgi:hypothetical protein
MLRYVSLPVLEVELERGFMMIRVRRDLIVSLLSQNPWSHAVVTIIQYLQRHMPNAYGYLEYYLLPTVLPTNAF